MPKRSAPVQNIEIDKLTDCIVHKESGEELETNLVPITLDDLKGVKKKKGEWHFNWRKELKMQDRVVYKLTTLNDPETIQGLVSVSAIDGYHYLNLVESAPINFGVNKIHEGVAGNMFAFCCKLSEDSGNEGIVSFESKTKLIHHYQDTLGAVKIRGQKMVIYPEQASFLIDKYFKK